MAIIVIIMVVLMVIATVILMVHTMFIMVILVVIMVIMVNYSSLPANNTLPLIIKYFFQTTQKLEPKCIRADVTHQKNMGEETMKTLTNPSSKQLPPPHNKEVSCSRTGFIIRRGGGGGEGGIIRGKRLWLLSWLLLLLLLLLLLSLLLLWLYWLF